MIVVILLFIGYETYFKGSGASTDSLISDSQTVNTTSAADQNFLNVLLQIQNISFNTAVFNDPVFTSLQDDGQAIADQPEGRPNPFAPIGTDSGSVIITGSSTPAATTTSK